MLLPSAPFSTVLPAAVPLTQNALCLLLVAGVLSSSTRAQCLVMEKNDNHFPIMSRVTFITVKTSKKVICQTCLACTLGREIFNPQPSMTCTDFHFLTNKMFSNTSPNLCIRNYLMQVFTSQEFKNQWYQSRIKILS